MVRSGPRFDSMVCEFARAMGIRLSAWTEGRSSGNEKVC